jgi:hypothetical protein
MTQKDEPELVTSGPYHLVRHPIYSGILVASVGTAVALSWLWLIAVALAGVYFVYSAKVEEHYLTEQSQTPTRCTSARPRCSCRSSFRRARSALYRRGQPRSARHAGRERPLAARGVSDAEDCLVEAGARFPELTIPPRVMRA